MGKPPAFQFYPADWLNDIKLQSCSMAAQGLFINMICLMHQSEKYGYLLINGLKPSSKVTQKLLRFDSKNAQRLYKKLTGELLDFGVLKQTEDGIYYCERMLKDEHIRKVRRESGLKGGNPNLKKDKPNPYYLDKQKDKQKITPSSSSSYSSSPSIVSSNEDTKNCPHLKIIEIYHKKLPMLPIVENHSEDLKTRLRTRWKEDPQRQNLEWWQWYFQGVSECDFLVGKVKDWSASFYWLTGPKNMTKVLNGEYLNRTKQSKTDQAMEDFVNERLEK